MLKYGVYCFIFAMSILFTKPLFIKAADFTSTISTTKKNGNYQRYTIEISGTGKFLKIHTGMFLKCLEIFIRTLIAYKYYYCPLKF